MNDEQSQTKIYKDIAQIICENGHYFRLDDANVHIDSVKCDSCKGKPSWVNIVDNTNGDFYGVIPLPLLAIYNRDGVYLVPNAEETVILRCKQIVLDGVEKFVLLFEEMD